MVTSVAQGAIDGLESTNTRTLACTRCGLQLKTSRDNKEFGNKGERIISKGVAGGTDIGDWWR